MPSLSSLSYTSYYNQFLDSLLSFYDVTKHSLVKSNFPPPPEHDPLLLFLLLPWPLLPILCWFLPLPLSWWWVAYSMCILLFISIYRCFFVDLIPYWLWIPSVFWCIPPPETSLLICISSVLLSISTWIFYGSCSVVNNAMHADSILPQRTHLCLLTFMPQGPLQSQRTNL